MKHRMASGSATSLRVACAVSIGLLASLRAEPAHACAPAPPEGARVRIADEEAIVLWDAKTKTQHFIRRASFASTSADFGFLVPTPSKPELGEIDNGIFDRLAQRLQPRIVHDPGELEIEAGSFFLSLFWGGEKSAALPSAQEPAPVRILETAAVGGMDAVVLEADSADALATWLGEHGFANTPSLAEWLVPYVRNHWNLTAFKISKAPKAEGVEVGTKAIRMSFSAPRPFFPYREPADQRQTLPAELESSAASKRHLRIYYLSTERALGNLGLEGSWKAATSYSAPYDDPIVREALPELPKRPWLTIFDDTQAVRPGTDEVYFSVSPDGAPIEPPPIHVSEPRTVRIPVDLVALGAIVGVIVVLRLRRNANA
ncbi:MAG: DUF2330 domain-containing protein [Polyangiaceae bacterium]|nr:DUF2330 domain-containing protein [Polyangiaceae bacterium]